MKSSTYGDSSGMPATPEKALCGSVSAKEPDWNIPRCGYCDTPAPGWTVADARNGKRWVMSGLEYHCFDGYCWD